MLTGFGTMLPVARGPTTRAVRAAAAAACRACAVAPARGVRLAARRGAAAQLRATPVVVPGQPAARRAPHRGLRVVAAAAAAGDNEPNQERALVRFCAPHSTRCTNAACSRHQAHTHHARRWAPPATRAAAAAA
jgi:hypothetical protein